MKKLTILLVLTLIMNSLFSQKKSIYQEGTAAKENINNILKLAPYSDGATGFDTRYEGVKGSTRMFDMLLPSYLKIKGQDYYIKLDADIDMVNKTVIFKHPNTGKLMFVPSDVVYELVITKNDGDDIIYRTKSSFAFEKGNTEEGFYQILADTPVLFVKMPVKIFTEADYKGAYSAERTYDEYETKSRYYIAYGDTILRQIQLNRNSILNAFPDKKEMIKKIIKAESFANNEEMLLSIIKRF